MPCETAGPPAVSFCESIIGIGRHRHGVVDLSQFHGMAGVVDPTAHYVAERHASAVIEGGGDSIAPV